MTIHCPDRDTFYEIIHCALWCAHPCAIYKNLSSAQRIELHRQLRHYLNLHPDAIEVYYQFHKLKRSKTVEKKYAVMVKDQMRIMSEEEIIELCATDFANIQQIFELGNEFEVVFKLIKKTSEDLKPVRKSKNKTDDQD